MRTNGAWALQHYKYSGRCSVMQLSVMYHVVNEGKDPTIPESLSKDGKEFLKLCFERNPERRANCTRLLQHPFLHPLNGNSRPIERATAQTFHPPVSAVFSPIEEESVAPSASLSGLRPKSTLLVADESVLGNTQMLDCTRQGQSCFFPSL